MALDIVNEEGFETVRYDMAGIPIYIRDDYLSYFPNYHCASHWHEDLECIYVLEGTMTVCVNGHSLVLSSGDTLIINCERIHSCSSIAKQECHFHGFILHPSLITTNQQLVKKYIEPITKISSLDYLIVDANHEITSILKNIYGCKEQHGETYELEILALFNQLWQVIFKSILSEDSKNLHIPDLDLSIQRQMSLFIYRNYTSDISLDEIAAAGNVSKSKCCKLFKKYMGQSPIDFANNHRLEYSKHLLEFSNLSITEICTSSGFNHASYFSKLFRSKYGLTPREFRNTKK